MTFPEAASNVYKACLKMKPACYVKLNKSFENE